MRVSFMKVKKNWLEIMAMVGILIVGLAMTIWRPFNADSIGYFADVVTPLTLIVAVLLILAGVRRR